MCSKHRRRLWAAELTGQFEESNEEPEEEEEEEEEKLPTQDVTPTLATQRQVNA